MCHAAYWLSSSGKSSMQCRFLVMCSYIMSYQIWLIIGPHDKLLTWWYYLRFCWAAVGFWRAELHLYYLELDTQQLDDSWELWHVQFHTHVHSSMYSITWMNICLWCGLHFHGQGVGSNALALVTVSRYDHPSDAAKSDSQFSLRWPLLITKSASWRHAECGIHNKYI